MKIVLKEYLKTNNISSLLCVDVGAKDYIDYVEPLDFISEIHAFEPNPAEFRKIQEKYKINYFQKLVLYNVALSNYSGYAKFHNVHHSSMSSLLEVDINNYEKHFGNYDNFTLWKNNVKSTHVTNTKVETLSCYFNNNEIIDYLKLDTQGSELLILNGAEKLLDEKRINTIKVEVSTLAIYREQAFFF